MAITINININESVKFKLNDYGKDIYYHQFDETNRKANDSGIIKRLATIRSQLSFHSNITERNIFTCQAP